MKLLSFLVMAAGVLYSLCLVLLCVVGLANTNAQQEAQIKGFIWATLLIGAGSLAGSIWLSGQGRYWLSMACALLPPIITGFVIFELSKP